MNIGIDVDGVLVDMGNYQLKYGTEYFKKKYNKDVIDPDAYDIEQIFDCTYEERERFWKKYIWAYCLTEPITPNAASVINRLHSEGHRIFIITGRAHTTEKGITGKLFRLMLRYWLKKNQVYYDEIIFCSEKESSTEKYDVCMKKSINVMIDDKPENLLALKDKIDIICYHAIWNSKIKQLDPYRVKDFDGIVAMINKR